MNTVTKTTTLKNAMAEAERENVVMRKGVQYDRLLDAARKVVSGEWGVGHLRVVTEECEAALARQAEEHARQWHI